MMKIIGINSKYFIYIYYILLLLIYLSWDNTDSVPGAAFRIMYYVAALVPIFVWKMSLLPYVIMLFFSLASNGYTSSYLPAMVYTYIVPLIICLLFINNKTTEKIPNVLFVLFFITLIINGITNFQIESITTILFIIILSFFYFKKDNTSRLLYLSLIIMTMSFVLVIAYYMYANNFSTEYAGFESERTGYADINYVASIIGFGVLLALTEIIQNKAMASLYKIFLSVLVLISIVSLFQNASRGSILALGVGIAFFIVLSKESFFIKIISLIVIVITIYYIYDNSYMDLLIYRINNDDNGGSGRIEIWIDKLSLFSQSDSIFKIIFGYGYIGGRSIEGIGQTAFHNDFIAFLVEYGFLGFCTFVSFMGLPIIRSTKENRGKVLACMAYLLIVCMTLEPFAAGRLPFYVIWLYIYFLSKEKNAILTK